jgi:hypothetical protein
MTAYLAEKQNNCGIINSKALNDNAKKLDWMQKRYLSAGLLISYGQQYDKLVSSRRCSKRTLSTP